MEEINITAELKEISFFPPNKIEEILQNVRTILTTAKFTVPLDRNFGLNVNVLDMPTNLLQAKLTAEIISAVHQYEPRVLVKKVLYQTDVEGKVTPKVRIAIR